jgi:hypothetical protein
MIIGVVGEENEKTSCRWREIGVVQLPGTLAPLAIVQGVSQLCDRLAAIVASRPLRSLFERRAKGEGLEKRAED